MKPAGLVLHQLEYVEGDVEEGEEGGEVWPPGSDGHVGGDEDSGAVEGLQFVQAREDEVRGRE